MIKGTKTERVMCEFLMETLQERGFKYLDSVCVSDKALRGLEDAVVCGFNAKVHYDLYYIPFLNPRDDTSSICDIFTREVGMLK